MPKPLLIVILILVVICCAGGAIGGALQDSKGNDGAFEFDEDSPQVARLKKLMQTRLISEDIVSPDTSGCSFDPAARTFAIASGSSCTFTIIETKGFLTRHANLRLTAGTAAVTLIPKQDDALTATKTLSTGEVFSGLDVYPQGADLAISCIMGPCAAALEE
jgi:hypothetical protein